MSAAASARASTPWKDNIEAMTMAIVMALLLKGFIVEAYKIPTGSMQPTLIGDEAAGIEDRILVDKLTYAFSAPERWDVAVFRYPLDRSQNFVKRIVGVGPEELRIDRGDLFRRSDPSEPWQILRRPPRVQAAAWKALDADSPAESSWSTEGDVDGEWNFEGRTLLATGPGRAVFRRGTVSIMDRYTDGYPEELMPYLRPSNRNSGLRMVGDLRLTGTVAARAELERLVLVLSEGLQRYTFEVPGPGADEDARASIGRRELGRWDVRGDEIAAHTTQADAPYRLPAGRAVTFAVENLDDRLSLEVDGRIVATLDVDPVRDQDSGVAIELAGDGAELTDVMVHRDIFYLGQNRQQVSIPAGHYFMLGDNTQDSSDGREWKFWRYRIPDALPVPIDEGGIGSAGMEGTRILRGNYREQENPARAGLGNPDGPSLRFVDEYGETHWRRLADCQLLGHEDAPFVPIELIDGRALAVFWPLDPRRDIYRLKWVH